MDDNGKCCCDDDDIATGCGCSVCYATITCGLPCPYCSITDPLGNQEEEENSDNDDNYFNSVGYIASYYSGIYSGGYWGFGYDGFGYYLPVNNLPALPTPTTTMQSATRILANSSVNPATGHVDLRGAGDGADAKSNLVDTKNGFDASRSDYGNAPGETIALSQSLLDGIETLSQNFTFSISEIAGGSHSVGSTHYDGISMDVNYVNGNHVDIINMTEAEIKAFREAAYNAGATKVLDPLNEPKYHYNHFHIQW